MIKFLLKNKIQFLASLGSNLIIFMLAIYIIADRLTNYIGVMSMIFGLLATYFFVLNIKKYEKIYRLRVTVLYVIFIVFLINVSKLFLDPSEVLSGTGIFIGFLLWIVVWNVADTVHNIREKSKLSLQDLEVK